MKFPIKTTDLVDIELDNDESATLVVIEALVNDDLNDLTFNPDSNKQALIAELQSWEKFEQYKELIGNQKEMLLGTVANRASYDESLKTQGENEKVVDSLVSKVMVANRQQKTKDGSAKRYGIFSLVASIVIIAGFSVIMLSESALNTGKTSSSKFESSTNPPALDESMVASREFFRAADEGVITNSLSSITVYDLGESSSELVFRSKIAIFSTLEPPLLIKSSPEGYSQLLTKLFSDQCSNQNLPENQGIYYFSLINGETVFGFIQEVQGNRITVSIIDC